MKALNKTHFILPEDVSQKTSTYQVYATWASLLTRRGNRNHVGNIPRAPRAAPRVPRAHRLVGVPAALQVTRVTRVTRVSRITDHHLQRDHDLHVRLLADRVRQAVCRQPHRLHSHQGHSRGKNKIWRNIVWFTCKYVIAVKIKLLILLN